MRIIYIRNENKNRNVKKTWICSYILNYTHLIKKTTNNNVNVLKLQQFSDSKSLFKKRLFRQTNNKTSSYGPYRKK